MVLDHTCFDTSLIAQTLSQEARVSFDAIACGPLLLLQSSDRHKFVHRSDGGLFLSNTDAHARACCDRSQLSWMQMTSCTRPLA